MHCTLYSVHMCTGCSLLHCHMSCTGQNSIYLFLWLLFNCLFCVQFFPTAQSQSSVFSCPTITEFSSFPAPQSQSQSFPAPQSQSSVFSCPTITAFSLFLPPNHRVQSFPPPTITEVSLFLPHNRRVLSFPAPQSQSSVFSYLHRHRVQFF